MRLLARWVELATIIFRQSIWREGGREGEREREREGGREGEREGGRERGREKLKSIYTCEEYIHVIT